MEAIKARVAEVDAAERATDAKWGLEAAKACHAETEATLRKSMADTEVALQGALETLEMEQNALESERKAQSEADQEVLVLQDRVMGTEEVNAQLREQVTR